MALALAWRMPTIHIVGNLHIRLYTRDHEPPHVHIVGVDFVVRLFLGSWKVETVLGKPRNIADAVRWVKANEARVREIWRATRSGP